MPTTTYGWTIANAGTEKTLADWGLSNPVRTLVSQGQDELTLKASSASVDSTPAFAYQSTITLYRNRTITNTGGVLTYSGGTIWFVGLVLQTPRIGAAGDEGISYKAAGPWWYLDNIVFQQVYKNVFLGLVSGSPTYGNENSSHLFLNQGFTTSAPFWGKITSGDQITAALNWALAPFSSGAPFQIGTIGPALDIPIDEVRDITCAEVIRKMLRWSPDAVTWFDYTTSPPTFNCVQKASLSAVNLALTDGILENLALNPRYDIQRSGVQIFYEQNTTVNGQSVLNLGLDQYPATLPSSAIAQFSLLQFTIDLQGLNASVTSATLAVDAINATSSGWWTTRHPQYKSGDTVDDISSITVDGASLVRATSDGSSDLGYTNELTTGQIAPWMSFGAQRITLKIAATITLSNGTVHNNVPLSYQCMSTNATSGTFYNETIATYPEPVPSGLAQNIYNAISVLQYDGTFTLLEAECSGSVGIGNTVNVTGSSITAWSTMAAQVQKIVENLETGRTTVEIGPAKHLGAGELLDLLRVSRNRRIQSSYLMRPNGNAASNNGGQIALGNNTPEKNSVVGHGAANPHIVSQNKDGTGYNIQFSSTSSDSIFKMLTNASGTGNKVQAQLSQITGESSAVVIQLRKVSYLSAGCTPVHRWVLCSDEISGA